MFLIFLNVILILLVNLSVSRPTENINAPFKSKLRRSITHLKDMLNTIEDKVKIEKKKLSQIVNNINRKNNVNAARTDTTVKPHFEDITPDLAPESFTFATLFPSPPEDSVWPPTETIDLSITTHFIVFTETTTVLTTTLTPFMQDMEKLMKEDKQNYFTTFLTRFTELVALKKPHDSMPIAKLMMTKLNEKLDELPFDDEVGKRLTQTLKRYSPSVGSMTPEKLKEEAMLAHFALKNKETMMSPEDNRITDFYGNYFNKEDGEALFKALEKFYEYNNGKHTAEEVVDMMLSAMLKPYLKVRETGIDTTAATVSVAVASAVQVAQNPIQVTQFPAPATEYPVTVSQYPVTETQYRATATQYEIPSWRRNMNFKQNVKHVLLKNPKLLEKIKEHYKIDNNKRQNYLNNGDRQMDEHEQTKQKAAKAPSYSDEEENLKTNLYDALRHHNMTFVSFRRSGSDVISNHPLRDISSEPDDEWVLKNNIYKFFEPQNDQIP